MAAPKKPVAPVVVKVPISKIRKAANRETNAAQHQANVAVMAEQHISPRDKTTTKMSRNRKGELTEHVLTKAVRPSKLVRSWRRSHSV